MIWLELAGIFCGTVIGFAGGSALYVLGKNDQMNPRNENHGHFFAAMGIAALFFAIVGFSVRGIVS